MWFWLSLVALFCWSGSDLFSKIGSRPEDRYSHWKMVTAVGLVMGLHAAYEVLFGGVSVTLNDIITYLPASFFYIFSMVLGYISLRYIELSISSPICNTSGAVAAVLCLIFLRQPISQLGVAAIALVGVGVLSLGIVEMREDDALRAERQNRANIKYAKSLLAFLLPVFYCLIDAAGTFIDCIILREEDTGSFLDRLFPNTLPEATANVSYELTFLLMGLLAAIYVFGIRRQPLMPRRDGPKLLGGLCETVGQFAYIFAIGDTAHAAPAAAIISAYCVLSVVWSRLLLRERLSLRHYAAIFITVVGIVLLGVLDL